MEPPGSTEAGGARASRASNPPPAELEPDAKANHLNRVLQDLRQAMQDFQLQQKVALERAMQSLVWKAFELPDTSVEPDVLHQYRILKDTRKYGQPIAIPPSAAAEEGMESVESKVFELPDTSVAPEVAHALRLRRALQDAHESIQTFEAQQEAAVHRAMESLESKVYELPDTSVGPDAAHAILLRRFLQDVHEYMKKCEAEHMAAAHSAMESVESKVFELEDTSVAPDVANALRLRRALQGAREYMQTYEAQQKAAVEKALKAVASKVRYELEDTSVGLKRKATEEPTG